MALKAALLPLNKYLFSNQLNRTPLMLLAALWLGFIISASYSLFAYIEMNHAKTHASHIVQLNNASQQLRQTVSASMLNQNIQMVPLEKEIQHFRYLLLRTKSNTIEGDWDDIQQTLLDADVFVEDVDNLLASIYSISSVTKQLKSLIDETQNDQLKRQLQAISSYLLFELHGLNGNASQNRTERFNAYVQDLESQMSSMPVGLQKSQLFTLYTGLERLNHQLESVDAVTNHKFVRAITQLQKYWTTRIVQLLDQTMISVLFAGMFLLALVFVSPGILRPSPEKAQATAPETSLPTRFTEDDKLVLSEPQEPLFEPAVLQEQLENDEEAIGSVLTMFVAEHQTDSQILRKHIESQEAARARTLVHNLKGVSGNIGALALQEYCTETDAKLRQGELITSAEVEHFTKLLSLTIQAVLREMEKPHKATAS